MLMSSCSLYLRNPTDPTFLCSHCLRYSTKTLFPRLPPPSHDSPIHSTAAATCPSYIPLDFDWVLHHFYITRAICEYSICSHLQRARRFAGAQWFFMLVVFTRSRAFLGCVYFIWHFILELHCGLPYILYLHLFPHGWSLSSHEQVLAALYV